MIHRRVIVMLIGGLLVACGSTPEVAPEAASAVSATAAPVSPASAEAPPTAIAASPAPTQLVSESPSARAGHELVYHAQLGMVLLVNGDHTPGPDEVAAGKVWGWDGRSWRVVSADGPSVRSLGGVAYDSARGRLVLYGGGTSPQCETDTWEWDGRHWERKDVPPPEICDHFAMVYDSAHGKTVLVGGQAPGVKLRAGTWEWDGQHWTQASATEPPPRVHYAFAYDGTRKKAVLFGGRDGQKTFDAGCPQADDLYPAWRPAPR